MTLFFRFSKFGDIFDSISIKKIVLIGCMHTEIALIGLFDEITRFHSDFGDPVEMKQGDFEKRK